MSDPETSRGRDEGSAEDRDAALYSPPRHYTRDHHPHERGPEDAPRVRGPEKDADEPEAPSRDRSPEAPSR